MVEVVGESGPAVLLLPGGAEAVDGFFPGLVEGLLADPGCRVLLYDRPGNGPSDEPDGLRVAADSLHDAILEAGIGPVIAVGQSLGGAAALLLAAQHPDDVAGLVLLDPTPINDPDLAAKVARNARLSVKLFDAPVIGSLLRGMLRRSARKSAARHGMDAETREAMLTITDLDAAKLGRAVVGIEDISRDLDLTGIRHVPAVVVTADRKPGDSIRRAHENLATALGATLVSWPRAEHAVHLTHPVEVLEECRKLARTVASD
ncbi:alpha/beta fold hydrolase [Microbacterium sp. EST19A]|uniref:alpha/beta fold hydrolase n=1 Tax=Microbacterium sp. EST19A TaxID=2862681 RepID=UPI001CBF6711|nr:alpha/beta hydrolase [Microbacterium sp. EST19A]